MNSPEVEPPDRFRSGRFHFARHARLANEQIESAAKIRHDCAWSRGPVLSPPSSRCADLAFGAGLNADLEEQVQQKR
jgi:hypothetical protein